MADNFDIFRNMPREVPVAERDEESPANADTFTETGEPVSGEGEDALMVDVYEARHALEDFRAWRAENRGTPENEEEWDAMERDQLRDIRVIEAELAKDAANRVLQQAELTRTQVEREVGDAILRAKGISREQIESQGNPGSKVMRALGRVTGGALGALGGAKVFEVANAVHVLSTSTTPHWLTGLPGLAGYLGLSSAAAFALSVGGGVAAASVIGWLLTRKGMNADKARRVFETLSSGSKENVVRETLMQFACQENDRRAQELTRLIEKEYGGRGRKAVRGMARLFGYEAMGAAGAITGAAAAGVIDGSVVVPNNLYGVESAAESVGKKLIEVSNFAINGAQQAGAYMLKFIP